MSAHAKRVEIVTSTLITEDADLANHLQKPGIKAKFAGPCEPMTNVFKRLKVDYGDMVSFVQNGVPVKLVRGANAPLVEKIIKDQVDLHKQGHSLPQLEITDDIASLQLALDVLRDRDVKKDEKSSEDDDDLDEPTPPKEGATSSGVNIASSSTHQVNSVSTDPTEEDGDAPTETTLGMIKPDGMHPSIIEEILGTIHRHRIRVVRVKKVWLSREQVAELYREHEAKEWFPSLINYISNAPILAMELSKAHCISLWREIVGPKDPKQAKAEHPKRYNSFPLTAFPFSSQNKPLLTPFAISYPIAHERSLRALYGTDSLMNTFHASDSQTSSTRELDFLFGETNSPNLIDLPFISPGESGHQNSLSPQKTLAIIKPDAVEKVDEIVGRIVGRGFKVQKREETVLNGEKVLELFGGEGTEEGVVEFLTSGPSICLVLKGEDVIAAWNEMLGPEDPAEAKKTRPMSIRAIYGTDKTHNAAHGSSTIETAVREISQLFPHYLYSTASLSALFDSRPGTNRNSIVLGTRSLRNSMAGGIAEKPKQAATPVMERTLALIKPDVYPGRKEEILERIAGEGFRIVKGEEVVMSLEMAKEFYGEHVGKPFFETLTGWMSSAPIYAMVLEKLDGIKAWRALAGPTNSEKARQESPQSLRALYGTDGSQNAVHGSDSPTSATREIHVVFGDTVSAVVPEPEVTERTLALIKPDAYPGRKEEILEAIVGEGFKILEAREVTFSREMAEEFYKEHVGKPFFETLTGWMSSAPIYAMILEKEGAITAWRSLAGPTNSEKARETSPNSIRARFGTDGSQNAVHGSDSPASAEREIHVVFGSSKPHVEVAAVERTLALIKPDAYPDKKDEILKRIVEDGFKVVEEKEVRFSKERAGEFYKEHLGKGFYEELTSWMSSAPIYAIVLEKEGAITAWRSLAGPTNSEKARETSPHSIRALFGTDGSQNAVHGSDSPASAEREINVVFNSSEPHVEVAAVERTLALIKPDAYPDKKDEILKRIVEDGFKVVEEKEVRFSKERAGEFYKEHLGKGFYEELTSWMSSAPIYAIVLEKEGAITAWRSLAGPTNSEKARETSPHSIRALFGTDGSQNAVHGSDSPASAEREIKVVFGDEEVQQTLALIKPDVYPMKKDEILERIHGDGFTVVREMEVVMSEEMAREFYGEHVGKAFYETLTTWMSSAPIYAMILEKPAAIKAWRDLAGPTNSEKARETSPNSIRALFGTDGSQNAVHGSDSPASANREIRIIFGDPSKTPAPKPPTAAVTPSASRPESPNKSRRTNPSTPSKGSEAQTPKRVPSSGSLKAQTPKRVPSSSSMKNGEERQSPAQTPKRVPSSSSLKGGDETPKRAPSIKGGEDSEAQPHTPKRSPSTHSVKAAGEESKRPSAAQTPKRSQSTASVKGGEVEESQPVAQQPSTQPNTRPGSKTGSKAASRAMSKAGSRHPSRPTSALANPPIDAEGGVAAGAEAE
ncbi:thioredoxin domain-containing protein 6 [Dinochytrium kinnereticum]|nr:thioredoxin domain-containing protein 6 [Dinochytrium kinnereticum]